MDYNKYINSFANSNEYNAYIESDKAYSPNIGFIEGTKQVKWAEKTMKECILYGTTKDTTDFMIGSSVINGIQDCINVHVVQPSDGSDNIMYASKEDIVKTLIWFRFNSQVKSIKKMEINTSNVTDMKFMFSDCSAFTSLNVSNFDTSKVTDMYGMFKNCHKLTSLDLSNFDTSKVTDMGDMFHFCDKLASLDLSNFDTSNVTNMNNMFSECERLTSLDLSNFDTSNVTNMTNMFLGCVGLTSLDLSNFDTSNVRDVANIFGWIGMTSLKLSSSFFNSSAATVFDFSDLYKWTEPTSLEQFVNAISSKDGTGKYVRLSTETKNALTTEQKNRITSKGWTIS